MCSQRSTKTSPTQLNYCSNPDNKATLITILFGSIRADDRLHAAGLVDTDKCDHPLCRGERAESPCMGEGQAGCQLLSHAGSRYRWGTSCPGSGPSTACRPGRCSGGTATQAGDGMQQWAKARRPGPWAAIERPTHPAVCQQHLGPRQPTIRLTISLVKRTRGGLSGYCSVNIRRIV